MLWVQDSEALSQWIRQARELSAALGEALERADERANLTASFCVGQIPEGLSVAWTESLGEVDAIPGILTESARHLAQLLEKYQEMAECLSQEEGLFNQPIRGSADEAVAGGCGPDPCRQGPQQ